MPETPLARYREERQDAIEDCLSEFESQPVLFVGSGLPIRYLDAPDWKGLLAHLCNQCPELDNPLEYHLQDHGLTEVAQEIAGAYQDWAWSEGRDEFPEEYFSDAYDSSIFLKHEASRYLAGLSPEDDAGLPDEHEGEIEALQSINPHAIITTNYDRMLEAIFPDYEPVVGEEILLADQARIGEIYKIHGCVSEPESLILTDSDYDRYRETRKYLTAKLLTLFAEHPVLIVGYGVGDDNVKSILSDIDAIWRTRGEDVVDNIFYCKWDDGLAEDDVPQKEFSFDLSHGRRMRTEGLETSNFQWIFEAFEVDTAFQNIDVRHLRRLLANSYELVRDVAPRRKVHFETLEMAAAEKDEFASLVGVVPMDEDTPVIGPQLNHPLPPSDLAEELGLGGHVTLNEKIQEIADQEGENIRESNNRYHVGLWHPDGEDEGPAYRRYSEKAKELLQDYLDGEDITLKGPFFEPPNLD
jgi:rRNA processing protein Gar1